MQHDRFEEQRKCLVEELTKLPGIELSSSGMHANSSSNWFHIQHVTSGKHFTIDSYHAADFSTESFKKTLEDFAEECSSMSMKEIA